jgi:BASS family bile acid:Na+ symporter
MTLDATLRLGLLVSIWLLVLALGARATPRELLFVLRRPALLLRALAAMFVVVPAFAITLAATTSLPSPIKFAIVAMSVGPVPPILPYKQTKAGGGEDYAIGLLVAAAIVAVALTPLLVAAAAHVLGAEAAVGAGRIARVLLLSIGLPLVLGAVVAQLSPAAARAIEAVAPRVGRWLLLIVFFVMLGGAWREIPALIGDGGILAIAATIAVGLLAGHLLGGGRDSSTALALAAASRHPGVALTIAELNYPGSRKPIVAAILLYLLNTALVTLPYVRWAQRRAGDGSPASLGEA